MIARKKAPSKYESPEAEQAAKNSRRRAQRAADPTYRERANRYQQASDNRRRAAGIRRIQKRRPEAKRSHRAARRAREAGAYGFHTGRHLRNILAWQKGGCRYCGKRAKKMHLDHMEPLIRGGSNWPWNLQYLCPAHNLAKGPMTDAEYRAKIGFPPARPLDHPYNALLLSIIA